MRTGNLQGNFDILPTVVYDSGELAAATTSITVSGLDGDNDDTYEIIIRYVNNYNGVIAYRFYPNGDGVNATGVQRLYGSNASVTAGRAASSKDMGEAAALGDVYFARMILNAKTGFVRTYINKYAYSIAGTTVTGVGIDGHSWNETATNITSLVFSSTQANGIGIGSRIIVLRRNASGTGLRTGTLNVQGKVTGAWQRIYSNTLAAAATSVTISGLDGNTDVMYRLKVRWVCPSAYPTNCLIYLNGDTGSNYGDQRLRGSSSSAAAARADPNTYISYGYTNDTGEVSLTDCIMYVKSGHVRTAISEILSRTVGTTVGNIDLLGSVWNNTVDNVTSVVVGSGTNGLGIGTVIELYKLNL